MQDTNRLNVLQKEDGYMLIVVVLILVVLTSLGLYQLSATSIGIMSSATEKRDNTYLANAEQGLKFAIVNFAALYNNTDNASGGLFCDSTDITDPVYLSMGTGGGLVSENNPCDGSTAATPLRDQGLATGKAFFDYVVDGTPVALVEIRAIMNSVVTVPGLTTAANDVPVQLHLSSAPQGYSVDRYKSRNYCITSTALDSDGNPVSHIVQGGVVMAVEKNTVNFLIGQ